MERETIIAFDIILEVVSSVYLLEPFRPSEVGDGTVLVCVHKTKNMQ